MTKLRKRTCATARAVWLALPLAAAALSAAARADDVPFAAPPSSRLGSPSETYYASLSDIMSVIQLRHIKLWQAGSAGDWRMTSFEIDQIKETFLKAALFYNAIPVANVVAVYAPLEAMRAAGRANDHAAFVRGFENLTSACNQCHTGAHVGFVIIQTPTSSPFTDQKF